jgi:phosphoadenosine phosphosulfate reductase
MVKKRLLNGEPCAKCGQAEDMLRSRNLWQRIDEVIIADEGKPESPGMQLAQKHNVVLAPFFIVKTDDGREHIHTSTLRFIKEVLEQPPAVTAKPTTKSLGDAPLLSVEEATAIAAELSAKEPQDVLRWALQRYGAECALAFSGAEDVALIDMAAKTGLPFSVFSLETGRLHPETYQFIEKVRKHYGIQITAMYPDTVLIESLVRQKGLFSFYEDGHTECCGIRKVEPLGRALMNYRAWVTGQRRDQSPTRTDVPAIQFDKAHTGLDSGPLLKLNPLAAWSLQQTWDYIRDNDVPYNALHERGYISIGCEPCTRAIRPGEHERAGRWWWEDSTKRECGLHIAKV